MLLSELALTFGEDVVREYAKKHWSLNAQYEYAGDWFHGGCNFERQLCFYRVMPEYVDQFKRDISIEPQLAQENLIKRIQWLEAQHLKDQKMIQIQRQMLGLLVNP